MYNQDMYNEKIVSVKLGNLLNTLAFLAKAEIENMKVSLKFLPDFVYGIHKKEQILNPDIPEKLTLNIESNDLKLNCVIICDLKAIQADGVSLYDHIQIIQNHKLKNKQINWDKTFITIPAETIPDIICQFNLDELREYGVDEEIIEAIISSSDPTENIKVKTL